MKAFIANNKKSIAATGICLLIAGITLSFQPLQFGPVQHYGSLSEAQDTIPSKKQQHEKMTMKDYDEMVKSLSAEMQKAIAEVKSIDAAKIAKEIEACLRELDAEKIKLEVNKAMKEVDIAAIQKEVKIAMKEMEYAKISEDIKQSLNDVKTEIEHIDMEEVNEQIKKAKAELKKSKTTLEKIDFESIIKEAGKNIEAAKQMMKLQKELFNEMEADGLINIKEGFIIEYNDKALYINGKKQPDTVTQKYKRYIPGNNYRITIEKE
jgi:DNA repair exonuclease SbcCD ATPase subunit